MDKAGSLMFCGGGSFSDRAERFYRWLAAGVWDALLAAGRLDWALHFVDATIVRALLHAAGARRPGAIGGEALWIAPKTGSRPSCIGAPKATDSRSPWC